MEIADQFEIRPSPVDTLVCNGDSIWLTADPDENVVITWYDEDVVIGTGTAVKVKPDGTKTYRVEGYLPGQEECAKSESVTVTYNEINFSFSINILTASLRDSEPILSALFDKPADQSA